LTIVQAKEKRIRNEGRTKKHYVCDEGRVRGEAGKKELKIKD